MDMILDCISYLSPVSLNRYETYQCYKNSQEINSHINFVPLPWCCLYVHYVPQHHKALFFSPGCYIHTIALSFLLCGFVSAHVLHWRTFHTFQGSFPPCCSSFYFQRVCGHYYYNRVHRLSCLPHHTNIEQP